MQIARLVFVRLWRPRHAVVAQHQVVVRLQILGIGIESVCPNSLNRSGTLSDEKERGQARCARRVCRARIAQARSAVRHRAARNRLFPLRAVRKRLRPFQPLGRRQGFSALFARRVSPSCTITRPMLLHRRDFAFGPVIFSNSSRGGGFQIACRKSPIPYSFPASPSSFRSNCPSVWGARGIPRENSQLLRVRQCMMGYPEWP